MKILALELSSSRGSLAWRSDDVDLERDWPNDRKNSGSFFERLNEIRKQLGPPERIIVGLGPGSYAGTRIAISAAVGVAFARPIQLLGYPSICAIDCDASYSVIGDARRQTFFFARVQDHTLIEGPELVSESQLHERLNRADGSAFAFEKLMPFAQVETRYPSARLLARLAGEPNRHFVQPPLEPMYLREPHITTPKIT